MGFSILWTCLNYLQVVVQDKVNASQQLHEGQDMPEPKVILPWFPCCAIPVLPAASLCFSCSPCCLLTSFSSSTHLSPSSHLCIPADGFPQQTAMEDAVGVQEECLSCLSHAVWGKFLLSATSLVPPTVVRCVTLMLLVQWLLSNHQILQQRRARPVVWNCNSC